MILLYYNMYGMKRMKVMLAAMCLSGVGLSVRAQLTIGECQRLAAENYPLTKRYALIRQTADYTVANLSKGYLPQLSVDAQATWQNDVSTLPEALQGVLVAGGFDYKGLSKEQYKIAASVNQVVYDGGHIKAAKTVAEREADVESRQTDVDRYELNRRVNELFFGVLLCDEQLRQNENLQALLTDNCRKLEAMVDKGTALRADVDAVRAELLTAERQNHALSATRLSYLRLLEIFIGREIDGTLVKPAPEVPVATDCLRPELAGFDARVDLLQARDKQLDAGLRPRLSLFAQGYYGYPGFDMFNDMFSREWSFNAMVGVKVSWNLSNFYTRRDDKRQIATSLQQVENAREVFRFNNRLQATENNAAVARWRRLMADDEEIIRLRAAVRRSAEDKLQHGVIDVNDLLHEINKENDARIALSTHEIELLKSIYDLKYTLNR
ncbi:MAG: TolC family protein [Alloprevotella sp.]